MNIDGHPLEILALKHAREGDRKSFFQCQDAFLTQVKDSGEDHCSCTEACKYHGNCLDCVIIHRGHRDHLPACFQSMVNERVATLACLTESRVVPPVPEHMRKASPAKVRPTQ